MSEVPEPKHFIGIVRWKNPEATLSTIFAWTGVRLNAAQLAAEGIDNNLASTLAFDAPIDAAVALDERGGDGFAPLAAFSVGVRSLDEARTAINDMGPVTEIGPGQYKIHLHRGKKKKDKPICVLSASVGASPARFVCGERERDVEALRAYMTRTLPKRVFGDPDFHVEFRVAPVVDLYSGLISQGLHMGAALLPRKAQIGEPTFDRAIDRLAAGVSDELGSLAHDIDSMTFDLSMAPDKATSTTALRMKGQTSWTAGTLASTASRAAAPPPMFWRLPSTATAAAYEYVAEARRFEAIRNTAGELVDGWLQHEGLPAADRASIMTLFGEKFLIDTPIVAALGTFASEAPAKVPAKGPPAAPTDPLQAALVKAGWLLVGIGDPNQVPDFVKAASAAASRAKIQAYLKDKLATASSWAERDQDRSSWLTGLTLKPAAVPKELPKGSLAFELALSHEAGSVDEGSRGAPARRAKTPPPVAKVQVLVVTESGGTWVALGADKAQLTKTILGTTQASPESSTLAARQDIAALRQTKLAEGGFFTLESVLNSFLAPATWVDAGVAHNAQDAHALLASTPGKGRTPIISTAEIKGDNGMTITVRTEVPRGVIEDAVLLAASSGLSARAHP
jgi:hypothetical protein